MGKGKKRFSKPDDRANSKTNDDVESLVERELRNFDLDALISGEVSEERKHEDASNDRPTNDSQDVEDKSSEAETEQAFNEDLIRESLDNLDMEAFLAMKAEGIEPDKRNSPPKHPVPGKTRPHYSKSYHFYWWELNRGGKYFLTFDVHNPGEDFHLRTTESKEYFDLAVAYAREQDQDEILIFHGGTSGTAWLEAMWKRFGKENCRFVRNKSVSLVDISTQP